MASNTNNNTTITTKKTGNLKRVLSTHSTKAHKVTKSTPVEQTGNDNTARKASIMRKITGHKVPRGDKVVLLAPAENTTITTKKSKDSVNSRKRSSSVSNKKPTIEDICAKARECGVYI